MNDNRVLYSVMDKMSIDAVAAAVPMSFECPCCSIATIQQRDVERLAIFLRVGLVLSLSYFHVVMVVKGMRRVYLSLSALDAVLFVTGS